MRIDGARGRDVPSIPATAEHIPAWSNGETRAQFPLAVIAKAMDQEDPGDSYELNDLPFQLARSYHAFRAFAVKTLTSEGLSDRVKPGTGGIYLAIARSEGCNVGSLAETFRIPKTTVTGLLRGLEEDGLVRREKDPEDARAYRLFLTEKGRGLLPSMVARHRRVLETMHDGLSDGEVETLKRLLSRVLDNISGGH